MYALPPTTHINSMTKFLLLMFFRCAQIILALLALNIATPSILLASDNAVLVITNNHNKLHHSFVSQLNNHLNDLMGKDLQIKVVGVDDWQEDFSNHHSLTLALGNKAAIKVGQYELKQPVLFSLLPSITYKRIIASEINCPSTKCSAIYIDQPLKRTLQLTQLALPELKTTGILTSQMTSINLNSLNNVARSLNIAIEHKKLINSNNLVFTLSDILQRSDALLSLPDRNIYSSRTVQNILLTAYRYRKPVIGYSRAFVKAGALFAVYSTPAQLSQQTAEVISRFFKANKKVLPEAQHPRYFTVSVNTLVAKSLGITIDTEETLQAKLEEASHE